MFTIARKVDLARNFDRMSRLLPEIYDFHPRTFLLPSQHAELKAFMASREKKRSERTFIIKPDRGSQGRGISIIQEADDIPNGYEDYVAQSYVKPFLIDGLKFDLRIYVLVTSIDPLRVYILDDGMARFCTEKYVKPGPDNLECFYAHLTNYSLNKKNNNIGDGKRYENLHDDETCFKRTLKSVMMSVQECGKDHEKLQREIDNIVRFTMIAGQPVLSSSYHSVFALGDGKSRCFEILGFDILIDENLKPWLLEVNCMPSLTTDSNFDLRLKHDVVLGALKIIDLKPDFKKILKARRMEISQLKNYRSTDAHKIFDGNVESEIAEKQTNYRQLLPLVHNSDFKSENDFKVLSKQIEIALIKSKEYPFGVAATTTASRAKKAATEIEMQERKKLLENPRIAKVKQQASVSTKLSLNNNVQTRSTTNLPSTTSPQVQKKDTTDPIRLSGDDGSIPSFLSESPPKPQSISENKNGLSRNHVHSPLYMQFSGCPKSKIDSKEEENRLMIRSKRSQEIHNLNMMDHLNEFFEKGNNLRANANIRNKIRKEMNKDIKIIVSSNITIKKDAVIIRPQKRFNKKITRPVVNIRQVFPHEVLL